MVDVSYLKKKLKTAINRDGVNFVYYDKEKTGVDNYGQPTYSVTTYNLKGLIKSLGLEDVRFVEAGYLPQHYIYLYLNPDDITFNITEMADEIEINNIRYMVRIKWSYKIGNELVYHKLLLRRIIGSG